MKITHKNYDVGIYCRISRFVDGISKYTRIESLNRSIVSELIECIKVHESRVIDGEKHQEIEIHYRFVGNANAKNPA